MNLSKRYIVPFIVVAITSLTSCNSSPTSRNLESVTPTPATPTPTPTQTEVEAKPTTTEPPFPEESPQNKSVNVTLYTSDTQCQELIPQKVSVSAEEPVTGAVGKILEQTDTADFSLSGYRVSIKDGVATVDLRRSPNSQRQITSLSSCEQFALFGSLRKTLTSNAQWKIKEVRFTEGGEEIVL